MVTLEELRRTSPKHIARLVTQDTVDLLNDIERDEDGVFVEAFKQNMLSHSNILKDGKFSLGDYINAVRFVSYKLMEMSNIDAYMLTFPDRYERLIDKFRALGIQDDEIRDKKISPYVSAYNKTELVKRVTEQALVPSHILNAHMFQEALNVQATLMLSARSEMVRSQAADSVLRYTKMPEESKIQLDITHKEDDAIKDLREEMRRLAQTQQEATQLGSVSPKEIAESNIVTAEIIEED